MKHLFSLSAVTFCVMSLFSAAPTFAAVDTIAPNVGDVFDNVDEPMAGMNVMYYVNANDNVAVANCHLFLDGTDAGNMPLGTSGSYGSLYYWQPSSVDTIHSARAMCTDTSGNTNQSVGIKYFHVTPGGDTSTPVVGVVSPTTATVNVPTTFKADYTDVGTGVVRCSLYDGGTQIWVSGAMTAYLNGSASVILTLPVGTHGLAMRCTDGAGNTGYGPQTPVVISSPADVTAPNVGDVFDNVDQPEAGTYAMYYVNANDNVAVANCHLFLDGTDTGNMPLGTSGSYGLNYHWPTVAVDTIHSARAMCTDTSGNTNQSVGIKYFHVTPATTYMLPVVQSTPASCGSPIDRLVKLADDGNPNTTADAAVYYYGSDCKRHAFPNLSAYMTWYADFSKVNVISPTEMANMPLGKNVTYRPGVRLVKFQTLPRVYAVAQGGVLRWVKTEDLASKLYGLTWNRFVDDIPDVFYGNYTFGSDISNIGDYQPWNEENNSPTVDHSL